ncbi:hypothetical protein Rsub_03583 [Raphidocelis subcapitata]|uniref:Thioredoxin domain-containing protein n=1 Tax=Raphidocelis subcapitata TaxID=307507 RepID=A0A2V0P092_9CHLO|nr:hypothetical protein Rsub_03583 [Raphidocelis subcapitata]|eukprot:GBF91263.1 hypothetical protein Rsub_03583 [Raphidocelis subcapitata]
MQQRLPGATAALPQRTDRVHALAPPPRPRAAAPRAGGAARRAPRSRVVAAGEALQTRHAVASWWQRLVPGGRDGATVAPEPDEHAIRQVTESELEALLQSAESSGRPLVVVFSATFCGPCKLLAKQLLMTRADMRAARGREFDLVKVEAPEEDGLSSRLGVHSLPCTFFVGGRGAGAPALRMEGLLAPSVIEDAVAGKSAVLGSNLRRAIAL